MRKILAVVSSVLLIGGAQAYAADQVAVVNVQQIFQQSPKIAALNKKLQSQFKGRQDKLIAAQKSLQSEVEKLKREAPTMSQKDKDDLQKKIVDDQSSLSKDATVFQQDLSKEQGKMMKNVLSELNASIATLAKKNNYSIVLDSQAVVYNAENLDITKPVASAFDAR